MRAGDTYHMYLSYMTGTGEPSEILDRRIVHFTSAYLVAWTLQGVLPRNSRNVIDAAVARTPDGLYRLWYKDEGEGSSTWSLSSPDLNDWTMVGQVLPGSPDAPPHEGPNVFFLSGYW